MIVPGACAEIAGMVSYISTRGPGAPQSFTDVLLSGMAPDGGLYIPDQWPRIESDLLEELAGRNYTDTAYHVIRPFIGDCLSDDEILALLLETYNRGNFDHAAIAPLVQIGPQAWILELFHGPTLSFKDYALQFLGRLFDYVLKKQNRCLTIVGATSGDTGSAAIEACRACENIDIFILHPKGRTSDVQRRQMTAVDAPNVHNIAVEGTFDDCQAIVKDLFANDALRSELNLSAVNSINWARIMAQIVYYVYAAVALGAPFRAVSFAVPTGNFGNVYAAWAAKKMGLPIERLIIGTNRNDILTRFFETGSMQVGAVTPSLSPSMDIQVSSNFERYLCDLLQRDHNQVRTLMNDFKTQKHFTVSDDVLRRAQNEFHAYRSTDQETLEVMAACYEQTGQMIDPHTAVALHAALQNSGGAVMAAPVAILACAHPSKFPDAIKQATGQEPPAPPRLAAVMDKPERYETLPADTAKIRKFIKDKAR